MFTQFTCFDIGTACIIMYCHFQEVKGLTEKLYAYALDWKKIKPVHMQNFKSSTAAVIELHFFMKKKMKMKNL